MFCAPHDGNLFRRQAVFLDRDGTLIEDRGYLASPSEVVFFQNTIPALRLLQKKFRLFIITNQAGIGEGFIKDIQVERVNTFILDFLSSEGIRIEKVYCCPHKLDDNCNCRKPSPYFIRKAEKEYRIDISGSFAVGDHPCDVQLAMNVGATGVFLLSGHGKKHRDDVPSSVKVVREIGAAARFIDKAHEFQNRQGKAVKVANQNLPGDCKNG